MPLQIWAAGKQRSLFAHQTASGSHSGFVPLSDWGCVVVTPLSSPAS
jgi:hypothetical protein